MQRVMRILASVLVGGALLLTTACGPDVPRGGFNDSFRGGKWKADFGGWDGGETREMGVAGKRSIDLSYDVRVDDGTLTLVMRNASGESVWEKMIRDRVEDAEEIPLSDPGEYTLSAYGTSTTGEFTVSW